MKKSMWAIGGAYLVVVLALQGLGSYHAHVINMICINIILCCSLNVLVGSIGQFSVAHASFYGFGAYTAAVLTTRLGFPALLSFIPAAVVAFCVGALVGLPALKVKGHYLALVTLGFVEISRLIFMNWDSVTKGVGGISTIPSPSIGSYTIDTESKFLFVSVFFALAAVIVCSNVVRSRVGRAFISIRENEEAAETMGVNSTWYKLFGFAFCSMLAGIAGSIYCHLNLFVNPESFKIDDSIKMLSIIIIGGVGNLKGTVVAAAVFILLPEVIYRFQDFEPFVHAIFTLAVLIFFPKGLGGVIDYALGRFRGFFKRSSKRSLRGTEASGAK